MGVCEVWAVSVMAYNNWILQQQQPNHELLMRCYHELISHKQFELGLFVLRALQHSCGQEEDQGYEKVLEFCGK